MIILWIGPGLYDYVYAQTWISEQSSFEQEDDTLEPVLILSLHINNRHVEGTLKVYLNQKLVRYSYLIGSQYFDGSARLGESTSHDLMNVDWLPSYNELLIDDLNSREVRMNYNSSSRDREYQDKGQIVFKRSYQERS